MARFSGGETAGGKVSLTFRWLGTAGVALNSDGQVLVLDPFFTRPSVFQMLHPLVPDAGVVAGRLPECHFVLVTHSHYDHLLDVPEVLRQSGAAVYGSPNTCQLLRILDAPASQVNEVSVGDQLSLGGFKVEVIRGRHSPVPFGLIFNGSLRPGLKLPLHVWDYRMDECLGYSIAVHGTRLLVCAAEPQTSDVLFAVAQEPKQYYLRLFQGVEPHTFVPLHWDNFTRSLDKPLRRFTRPGRMSLNQLDRLAMQLIPRVSVIIPELFKEYSVREQAGSS
jgi:L-ascorbate metabolism protein UlaG (beta-lactamase superfamily)